MSDNYSFLEQSTSAKLIEQETNINYNREEDMAVVYTASAVDIRKLDKLFEERGDEMELREKTDHSRTYLIPKKWMKIRPNRILSEEQKEVIRDRFKNSKNNPSSK